MSGVTNVAGSCLLSWAHRESVMRHQALILDPVHCQYAGDGRITGDLPDGAETVFMAIPVDVSIVGDGATA